METRRFNLGDLVIYNPYSRVSVFEIVKFHKRDLIGIKKFNGSEELIVYESDIIKIADSHFRK